MMWGWGWGDWWIGGVMMLVFWVALIAAVVWLVHSLGNRPPAPEDRSSARRILDERFASGEITEEEYQRRRQALSH